MANLDGLNPFVKEKAEQLLINANKRLKKYKMKITQGYRSKAEQDALYAKGRRGIAGEKKVTNAKGGQSMHNYGLAIDFCLIDQTGKIAVWDTVKDFDKDGVADWMEVVAEAEKLNFEWGGRWRGFVDCPHLQMLGGLDEKDIIAGKKPVFKKVTTKQIHTIVRGDTVSELAVKYKTTIEKIKVLNPTINIDLIYPGQKIRIK